MRRERVLERAMYDGRLTAHLHIPDLRSATSSTSAIR